MLSFAHIARAGAGALGALALSASLALAGPDLPGPLVESDWLHANLEGDGLVVIEVRTKLGKSSREAYLKGHIPNAVWTDYPGPWRTTRDGVGGVISEADKLEAYLSDLGVSNESTVVIVPEGSNSLDFGQAARLYWTFKTLGHDAVAILNGGFRGWVADPARPVATGPVTLEPEFFEVALRGDDRINTGEVAAKISKAVLIDSRPLDQFAGREKHKDAKAYGRLPGARSLDQALFYDAASNRLKPHAELKRIAARVVADRDAKIVAYCNTGHWAATSWFVLSEVLGYENVRMYDESMVGWTQDPSRPIEDDRTPLDEVRAWIAAILG